MKRLQGPYEELRAKVEARTAMVCVVGLGYVGVPLSVASGEAGFQVVGIDVDRVKVSELNSGVCYVEDRYSEKHLRELISAKKIRASTILSEGARRADVVIICVPTPLDKKGEPDLSYVRSVSKSLSNCLSGFKLIILESTSFPGTTEDIVRPLLESKGKRASKDFALVYSPERIDYGNPKYSVKDIPKLVGGVNPESTKLGAAFYRTILRAQVHEVTSPSVAEAAKILENIFRYVNIALVNELSILHEALGVDFIEAIRAAETKPFGFLAHYPGPGIGGHCIPKDPFYLVYRAKKLGLPLRLVSAANTVNKTMPTHVVARLFKALKGTRKGREPVKVALWGLAYKGEVRDTRRSPSIEILRLLKKRKVNVTVYDPYVPRVVVDGRNYESARSMEESVLSADCIVVATNHNLFRRARLADISKLMKARRVMFDTKNLLSPDECRDAGFTYIATGKPG